MPEDYIGKNEQEHTRDAWQEPRAESRQELPVENEEDLRDVNHASAPKPHRIFKTALIILGNTSFALLLIVMAFLVFTMVQSRIHGGPPALAGYQMYIVQGGSMSPAFEVGSLAFLRPADPARFSVGDIITFRSASGGETLTTHRIVAVNREEGRLSYTTRGDANQTNDPLPVLPENIVGRISYSLPYLGYLMSFGQSKTGIITLVFIPGVLIIIFELRNLFRLAAQWEEEKKQQKKVEKEALPEEA